MSAYFRVSKSYGSCYGLRPIEVTWETGALPVFGKEAMFGRRTLSCGIMILCCVVFPLSGLEVSVNGKPYQSLSDTDLTELISPLPAGLVSPEPTMGIAVSHLIPVMFEAWRITIDGEVISDDSLAERLEHSYLFRDAGVWSIQLDDGLIFQNTESLSVEGEELLDDELEIWVSWEGEGELKAEISAFADRNGIEVTVIHIPNPESRLVSVLRGGGDPPDLIMCSPGNLYSLVESGALQPLPAYLSTGLGRQGLDTFSYQGRQWALPFYYDTQLLIYNPDLIDLSGGSSLTLSDLERAVASLVGTVPVPMSWNAYSSYWLMPFQASFGKECLTEPDGSIILDDEPTEAALSYIVKLAQQEYFTPLERDAMISFFASGRAGVIYSASYSIPYFQELRIPFAVAPALVNDRTGLPVSPMLDYKAIGLTRQSKHPVLAYRLLSYLMGIEVQTRFNQQLFKLPANTYAQQLLEESNAYYRTITDQASHGQTVPSTPSYAAYKNIMWKLLRFALSGQLSPAGVLQQGERLLKETLP